MTDGDTAGIREPESSLPRGYCSVAWLVIAVVVATRLALTALAPAPVDATGEDPIATFTMKMQGRYLVGAGDSVAVGDRKLLYTSARALDVGTVGQRQRFVVLASELAGVEEARARLEALDADIAEAIVRAEGDESPDAFSLGEDQAAVQALLVRLYPAGADAPAADAMSPDERALLVEKLGWFGELALAPAAGADDAARDAVIGSATRMFYLLISVFVGAGVLGVGGFVGLVIVVVLAFMQKLRAGIGPGIAHHGIYAETFAIWLAFFFGLQFAAAIVAPFASGSAILVIVMAFFLSLGALAWPVVRGVPFAVVREDIGWTGGRSPLFEPIAGVMAYAMGLPILAIGLVVTLLFMAMQGFFSGAPEPLAPAGGPAHPIVAEIGDASIWGFIQVLVLGAIAAPIIEETMFRGVLYRHLRDATARLRVGFSVVVSGLLNGFVFAIIHPQGWVAVPALMSLAFAFSLAREWRGTVIPSIVMHGVSNALVLSLVRVLATI